MLLLLLLLAWLTIEHPKIGIPLCIVLAIVALFVFHDEPWRVLGYGLLSIALLAGFGALFWFNLALGAAVLCVTVLGGLGYSWWRDRTRATGEGWESAAVKTTIPNPAVNQPILRPAPEAKASVATPDAFRELLYNAQVVPFQPSLVNSLGPRDLLVALQPIDPDFSPVLFEDFLSLLFVEVQRARGTGDTHRLAPFLSPSVANFLASTRGALTQVRDVLIGAIQIRNIFADGMVSDTLVMIDFEANFTEVTGQQERGVFAVERWMLERSREARSGPPERSRVLSCPACGAPLEIDVGGVCRYCKEVFTPGKKDWVIKAIQILQRDEQGPVLTRDVEEQGNQLPTIVDPEARARYDAIAARDPAFSSGAFRKRVELIFTQLQGAWSARDLSTARPFLSDRLYQSFSYWIEAYKKQGLRNVLTGSRIVGIELARVSTDRWFDAITIRIFASGIDFTAREDGTLVSGRKDRERPYTEYWTLIRSASRSGAARDSLDCPNCGAPIAQINMAGACGVCSVKVSTGEFDWVLSRIEQDEAYLR